ncbi:MAG: hypothetical protein LH614_14425, partial [Pyrinomonadaceae bacterium]|nr:hypothetical protein [Pyrinomonadaceae bacterium]
MSIINKRFSAAVLIFAELLIVTFAASAQKIEATIKITPPDLISVEGKFINGNPKRSNVNWSFLNSIGGAENLAARVSDFSLTDRENRAVAVRKMADGEYLADAPADVFRYRITLKNPANIAALAHVSALFDERGLLMLDDLL